MKKPIRVWIVRMLAGNPFEDNPFERSVSFASYLADKGYKVTFWGTAFDHALKEQLFSETIHRIVKDNEDAVMIHVPTTYKKNMSLKRLIYSIEQGSALKKEIYKKEYDIPDIIFAAHPTAESCNALEKYAKKHRIPVIVDQRDRWPDIFENAFPKRIKKLGKYALIPLKKQTQRAFENASAICAMSPKELEFGLHYAGRKQSPLDEYIYIGRKKYIPEESKRIEYLSILNGLNVTDKTWNICLFSSISKMSLDGDTLIEAIRMVHNTHPEIRLIVGGVGDDKERLTKLAKDSPYIQFLGHLNDDQMSTIMSICKVGVFPYKNSSMREAWGNKIGQYLSYGLPILTSTEGIAYEYFMKYKCGLKYQEGDQTSLADAIIELINNKKELEELADHAKDRFISDFEYGVVMGKLEKMLLRVLENNGPI